MNLFNTTSQSHRNRNSKFSPIKGGKLYLLALSMVAISCLGISSASAGDGTYGKKTLGQIHLTGLSINISPGGFHIGIGVPSYGRAYGHSHYRPAPRHFWNHSKRHHRRHHHYDSPKRFNRGHGWKKDRHRGYFRGKGSRGGRGNGGHRGGGW